MEESKEQLNGDAPKSGKKVSGKLIGGIIAAVAILAIGVGIFALNGQSKSAFKKLKGTPEEIVVAAISNTNEKCLEEQSSMSAQMGLDKVNVIQNKEASETKFNLGLEGISGIEEADIISAYIKDIGLSGTFQSTKSKDKVAGDLKLTQSGIELLGASIYKDGNEVGINIPKILDAPYAIKVDSFVEDFKKSDLGKLMNGTEISDEELNEITEIFSAFGEYMEGAMNLSTNKEFMTQTQALQTELIKNAKIKENGKQTVTLSDGSTAEWTVYTGSLTGQELMDFINKEINLVMSLDFVKNYFDVIAKQSGYTTEEMLEEMKQTLVADESVATEIDFLVDDAYFRGFTLGINENEERVCNINVSYTGAQYLTDEMTVGFNVVNDEEQVGIDLVFSENLGEKADVFSQAFNLYLNENDQTVGSITYTYDYDTKATEDNLSVYAGLDFGSEAVMNYTAIGTKVINNEEVSTNLQDSSITIESEGESITVDFNLAYGVKAIKSSDITIDKTGVKYLLEMSEEELTSAIQSIQSNIQAFAYGLL